MSESEGNNGQVASIGSGTARDSRAEQQSLTLAAATDDSEAMEVVDRRPMVSDHAASSDTAVASEATTATTDAFVQMALAAALNQAVSASGSTSATTTGLLVSSSQVPPISSPAQPVAANTVTVGDIENIVDSLKNNTLASERLMHLVNRLVPFAKSLPGTPLAFKNAKKELHSIVASPLYDKKPWRWFITFSNADLFEEYIFRMICSDGNGNVKTLGGVTLTGEEAEAYLRSLTLAERTAQLRMHPALATRSYMIKQQLIMKYIVEAQEIFGKVVDHWIRVEFQRSLNAHLHIILSVHDDSNLERLALVGQRLSDDLASLLKTTCTAEVSYVLVVLVALNLL